MGKRNRYLVQEWIYRYGGCVERARDVTLNDKTDAEKVYNECKQHLKSVIEDKDVSDSFVRMHKLDELGRVDKTIRCYIPTIGEL